MCGLGKKIWCVEETVDRLRRRPRWSRYRRARRAKTEGTRRRRDKGGGAEQQQTRVRDTWMAVIGSRTKGPVGRADHVAALARRWVLDRALAVAQSVKWGIVFKSKLGPCKRGSR